MFFISIFQHFFTGKEIDGTMKVRVCFIPAFCTVVTGCIAVNNLLAALTKDVNIVISDSFGNFYICTIHGSKSQCTVQHEFHVSGSGCFFGSKADLFRKITCRNHFFCCRNIVVFYKCKLQISGNFRVRTDNL